MLKRLQATNWKLFLLVIFSAVVPTFIVGILTLRISEQAIRKETEVKLSVANTTARKQLIDWVGEHKEAIGYLSVGIEEMIQAVDTLVHEQSLPIKQEKKAIVAHNLKRFVDNHKSFVEIFLLHPDTGEVLVSTIPPQEGKLHADRAYFIQGKKQPFVQNVYYLLTAQQLAITISAPVHTTDGRLVGVVAGQLNLDQLTDVLHQPSGLGETVKSYAVNTFKLIVAGLPNEMQEKENYKYHQLNTVPVVEGLQGRSGVTTYETFDGTRVVGSYLPIPELDLLVITEIDEREILKPIRSLGIVAVTTIVITLGVTILVATYVMRFFLAKEAQLERMKLDFVAMSAHELRTPLTTVVGYLSFLMEDPVTINKLASEEKEILNRAFLNATRLGKLIDNLLVVSRIEKGRMSLNLQPVQLEDLIDRIIKELKNLAQMKKIYLEFQAPNQPLPMVLGDRLRIEEVVSNLVGNAINYTSLGGVSLSIARHEDELVVAVKDTGQGIPKEARAHLFTKFFRVKAPLEAGTKGTGLGLYISKNIIDAHKGRIWVESEAGKGSTFYFSLPIAHTIPPPQTLTFGFHS